jgi:hypothetical protein
MNRTTLTVLALALAAWPAHASAQSLGGRAYITYGTTHLTSTQSFEAIAGTSNESGVGVGGMVTGLWREVFVDVAYTQQKFDGDRVFVDQGSVYSLGIPTRITIRPIDVAAGWMIRGRRVAPYFGAGVTFAAYKEESDFAIAGDDVNERKTGPLALVGADVRDARLLSVGGELRYRSITGVLGSGGVSQQFGEDQLGGVSFALRVAVGR